jgi:hypothetical protein
VLHLTLPRRLVRLLCCVVAALLARPAAAQAPPAPSPALLEDARSYAARYKVGLDEAVRRLRVQVAVGRFEAALTADEAMAKPFAGLWLEHDPVFRVVVNFVDTAPWSLSALREGPLGVPVVLRPVRWTLAQLQEQELTATELVRKAGVRFDSDINVFENQVEIHVLEDGRSQLAAASLALPPSVKVILVDGLMQRMELHGGTALSGCTGGFTVRRTSDDTLGILTAAHCSNSQRFNEGQLHFVAELYGGARDLQWHSACGFQVSNLFNSGNGMRPCSGTSPRSSQSVGGFVCKYGMVTERTCGEIESKTFRPDAGDGVTFSPSFIRVEGDPLEIGEFATFGDSGGPWYLGHTAYGITMGGFSTDNDAVYTAIDYIGAFGVSVLTFDPQGVACQCGASVRGTAP